MIFTGSAAGVKTPPLLIFQGKRLPNQIKQILPKDWHANCSESGWMNTDIFYSYITQIFYPWLATQGILTPVILFVDGHISHRSLKLSEFCMENKIVLVSFLPNTTHICQPMDVVVYGPIKRKWAANLKEFRNSNRTIDRMPKGLFCDLLNKCVNETCTSELLKTSFAKTGLDPFNPDSFDYSKLTTHTDETSNDINTDNSINQPRTTFLDRLENLIELTFPGRLNEFKRTDDGEWLGEIFARDLFLIWKEAGGVANLNPDNISENETFELVDVIDSSEFNVENIDRLVFVILS